MMIKMNKWNCCHLEECGRYCGYHLSADTQRVVTQDLLAQAQGSICHCYAKHCFGREEIELRRLSCPYHFHQPDQKHIEPPPTEGHRVT